MILLHFLYQRQQKAEVVTKPGSQDVNFNFVWVTFHMPTVFGLLGFIAEERSAQKPANLTTEKSNSIL